MHESFQYGLKDGLLIHVSDVESGLKCGCVCPACGNPFVAHKGQKMKAHFKHLAEHTCSFSFETSLHYLAKEIIAERQHLFVPYLDFIPDDYFSRFFPERGGFSANDLISRVYRKVQFDTIEIERWEGDFRPDLKCYVRGVPLLIEITVTHGIDEAKLKKIRESGIPLLEINLEGLEHDATKKDIWAALYDIRDSRIMRWVYNPKEKERRVVLSRLIWDAKIFLERRVSLKKMYGRNHEVYDCPLRRGHKYLDSAMSFDNSCSQCRYMAGVVEKDLPGSRFKDRLVQCVGEHQKEIDAYFSGSGKSNTE